MPLEVSASASASACVSPTILKTDYEGSSKSKSKSEGNPYTSPGFRITSPSRCVQGDQERGRRRGNETDQRLLSRSRVCPPQPSQTSQGSHSHAHAHSHVHAHSRSSATHRERSGALLQRHCSSHHLCAYSARFGSNGPVDSPYPPVSRPVSSLFDFRLAPNLNLLLHRNSALGTFTGFLAICVSGPSSTQPPSSPRAHRPSYITPSPTLYSLSRTHPLSLVRPLSPNTSADNDLQRREMGLRSLRSRPPCQQLQPLW